VNHGQPDGGKFRQVLTPAALEIGKQEAGLAHEALDVNGHAARPIGLELVQALAHFGDRAVPVALSPVVEADPDLEDPLVQVADRVRLGDPDALQGLVLLEELPPVELLDAVQEGGRRRVIAAGGATGRRFLWRGQAEAWLPTEARMLSPSGEAAGSSR
jgi:hypothetical protein